MVISTIDRIHFKRDIFLSIELVYNYVSTMLDFLHYRTSQDWVRSSKLNLYQQKVKSRLNKQAEDIKLSSLETIGDLKSIFGEMMTHKDEQE
jgi:hypothetical protein